jgi:hypothetical protein
LLADFGLGEPEGRPSSSNPSFEKSRGKQTPVGQAFRRAASHPDN